MTSPENFALENWTSSLCLNIWGGIEHRRQGRSEDLATGKSAITVATCLDKPDSCAKSLCAWTSQSLFFQPEHTDGKRFQLDNNRGAYISPFQLRWWGFEWGLCCRSCCSAGTSYPRASWCNVSFAPQRSPLDWIDHPAWTPNGPVGREGCAKHRIEKAGLDGASKSFFDSSLHPGN